jgi:hypothetical protein
MNIVITSHEKAKWGKDNKGNPVEIGRRSTRITKLDYLFDLVLSGRAPRRRSCRDCRRRRASRFPIDAVIPFSYAEIAAATAARSSSATPCRCPLATPEQAKKLRGLLAEQDKGGELLAKWLDKSQSESIEEMPSDVAQACIDYLDKTAKAKADIDAKVA